MSCKYCYEDGGILVSPCKCDGSMKYVHKTCLQKHIKLNNVHKCEICNHEYGYWIKVRKLLMILCFIFRLVAGLHVILTGLVRFFDLWKVEGDPSWRLYGLTCVIILEYIF